MCGGKAAKIKTTQAMTAQLRRDLSLWLLAADRSSWLRFVYTTYRLTMCASPTASSYGHLSATSLKRAAS